jgi:hypothetical protein
MKNDATPMHLVLALLLLAVCAYAPAPSSGVTIKAKSPPVVRVKHSGLPACLLEGVAHLPC